jgi:arginase
VASIAGRVRLRSADDVRRQPGPVAAEAAAHLARHVPGWWLHIDLDVLRGADFPACGAANDPAMPGGLTWSELPTMTATALRAGGCRGWSLGVYNTHLDPTRESAARIVDVIRDVGSTAGSVALAGPVPVSQTGAVIRSNVARHALRLAIGFRGR